MFCFSVIDSFGFQLLKSMSIICSHLEPPVVELSSRKLLWFYILSTSTNKTDSHIWLKYWWTWRLTPKPPSNNNNNNEQITNWKKRSRTIERFFPSHGLEFDRAWSSCIIAGIIFAFRFIEMAFSVRNVNHWLTYFLLIPNGC